jgi:hypothetical protein
MKRSKILATALGLSLSIASIGIISDVSAYNPDAQMSSSNPLPMQPDIVYLERTITKAGNNANITSDGHFTYDFRLVRTASGGTSDPCVTTPSNCVGGIDSPVNDNILDHAHVNFSGLPTYDSTNKTNTANTQLGLAYLEFYREDVYYFEVTENAIESSLSGKYERDTTNKYTIVIAAPSQSVDADGETIIDSVVPAAYVVEVLDKDGNKIDALENPNAPLAFSADRIVPNTSIELTKTVKGAFARTDINFNFLVTVTGGTGTYDAILGNGNSTTCTYGTACSVTAKHGETIYLGKTGNTEEFDPTANLTYTIAEVVTPGYETTATINGSSAILTSSTVSSQSVKTTASQNILEADPDDGNLNIVEFTNKKDLLPSPTGVFFNIIPFIGLGIAAFIGIVALKKTKQEA